MVRREVSSNLTAIWTGNSAVIAFERVDTGGSSGRVVNQSWGVKLAAAYLDRAARSTS